eukprot:30003-Pelagococcus_subviridis.AAC.3
MITFASGMSIELSPTLERKIHPRALRVARLSVNQRPSQRRRVLPQREDVIAEDDDLILPLLLVELHEVLARHELVRVHAVQRLFLRLALGLEVLCEKLRRHRAPHLDALHVRDVPVPLQVFHLLVLAHERRGEPELAVRFRDADHLAEHRRRDDVHLVQEHYTPLPPSHLFQHPPALFAAFAPRGYHVIRRHAHARLVHGRELFLRLRREPNDLAVGEVRPQLELRRPLVDAHGRRAQTQARLPHPRRGGDPGEGLPGAARKDDDPAPRAAVAEHLREALLLVRPNPRHRLQRDVQVRVPRVVPEVVLLQRRVPELPGEAPLLHVLHLLRVNLERRDLPQRIVLRHRRLVKRARLVASLAAFLLAGTRGDDAFTFAVVAVDRGLRHRRGRLIPQRARHRERLALASGPRLRPRRRRHARLSNRLVPQQRPQHARVGGLEEEPIPLQHELHLAVVGRARLHERVNFVRELRLREPTEHAQDGRRLQSDAHRGVQRVRREQVLVHVRRSAHRLRDGYEEVVRRLVHGRERLEEDAPVAADPQRAVRVVGLQDEIGEVVVSESVSARPHRVDLVVVAVAVAVQDVVLVFHVCRRRGALQRQRQARFRRLGRVRFRGHRDFEPALVLRGVSLLRLLLRARGASRGGELVGGVVVVVVVVRARGFLCDAVTGRGKGQISPSTTRDARDSRETRRKRERGGARLSRRGPPPARASS